MSKDSTSKTKRKRGRPKGTPASNKIILTEEQKKTLETLAGYGMTDKELSLAVNISTGAYYNIMKRDPDLALRLKQAKSMADAKVINALYKNAANGNVTAQQYWLRCRRPDQWREKHQFEVSETKRVTITVEDARRALLSEPGGQEILDVEVEPLDGPASPITGTDTP